MTIFADSIRNLTYEGGIVSFDLTSNGAQQGQRVCIPYGQLSELVAYLDTEVKKIGPYHLDWVSFELDRLHAEQPNQETCPVDRRDIVGALLASI